MSQLPLFDDGSGALFSDCGKYRYLLWRDWTPAGKQQRTINFLMLNPSIANKERNDQTVERCQRRSVALGFTRIVVTNLFAWVSTDRSVLSGLDDPVGPENDQHIITQARAADLVVCAWGADGRIGQRSEHVRRLLSDVTLHALTVTAHGEPGHPLYLPYALRPIAYP
ncbi:DUF1643 domain-containing protein [bacterium]|nr:DUF1643 domain-containing protein [bacterium]